MNKAAIITTLQDAVKTGTRRSVAQWARVCGVSVVSIRTLMRNAQLWSAFTLNLQPRYHGTQPVRKAKYLDRKTKAVRSTSAYLHIPPAALRGAELQFADQLAWHAEPGRIVITALSPVVPTPSSAVPAKGGPHV